VILLGKYADIFMKMTSL